ncbi:hypothetical protein ACFU6I_11335 [Streptomyces sp. NPDC057486]|uniref:hypothetical protein n=1 Tax=Streptomyces sp. NPDC057486 TaxID=3346145 RepID=UPI0036742BB1
MKIIFLIHPRSCVSLPGFRATEADAAVHRAKLRLPGVRVLAIPNGVADLGLPPAETAANVIAAAGRLARGERFGLLTGALADIAPITPAGPCASTASPPRRPPATAHRRALLGRPGGPAPAHGYAVLGVILALGPIFAVVRRRLAAG